MVKEKGSYIVETRKKVVFVSVNKREVDGTTEEIGKNGRGEDTQKERGVDNGRGNWENMRPLVKGELEVGASGWLATHASNEKIDIKPTKRGERLSPWAVWRKEMGKNSSGGNRYNHAHHKKKKPAGRKFRKGAKGRVLFQVAWISVGAGKGNYMSKLVILLKTRNEWTR